MTDIAKKEYTAGGYRFIECALCGARFNAGRPGNSAGVRWSNGYKAEWWAKHTGIPQHEYALELCKEDIPQLCPHVNRNEQHKEDVSLALWSIGPIVPRAAVPFGERL